MGEYEEYELLNRVHDEYRKITKYLISNGLTVSTMESCTSGFIASLITDTEGASAVLKGSFVTYSNEAKILQGVPADVIKKYGVYSENTAAAMAKACMNTYSADLGIGVTGTFGNMDLVNDDSVPGEVYISIAYRDEIESKKIILSSTLSRFSSKIYVAQEVFRMMLRGIILKYGLSFPRTYQDAPFHDPNWQLIRVKPSDKVFLWTYERNGYININVKVNPEWRDFFRQQYASVIPGYHLNKEHWNTVILDGSVPFEDVKRMIAESYDCVADSPTSRIYEAVRSIPKGYVATYGQIADLAGDKKMARAVGNALHKNPDPEGIPCYRVVNSMGKLASEFVFGGEKVQENLLKKDGIEVVDGKVDLKKYGIDVEAMRLEAQMKKM